MAHKLFATIVNTHPSAYLLEAQALEPSNIEGDTGLSHLTTILIATLYANASCFAVPAFDWQSDVPNGACSGDLP